MMTICETSSPAERSCLCFCFVPNGLTCCVGVATLNPFDSENKSQAQVEGQEKGNATGVQMYRDTVEACRDDGPAPDRRSRWTGKRWNRKLGDSAAATDGQLIPESVYVRKKRTSARGGGQAKILQRYTQTTSDAVMRWQNLKPSVVI
jgi:hypothetical protein